MATQINNTAIVTYGYGRSGQASATSNMASTSLIEEYAISGYKMSLNSTFRPAENITYVVYVRNDGTEPLYNVQITDDRGGSSNTLTYVENSASYNYNGTNTSITPTVNDDNIVFTLPQSLAGGDQATITYVMTVSPFLGSSVQTLTNTATITANEGSMGGQQISVSPVPSVSLPLEDFADVTINKVVSASEIVPGQQFSYTLTLSNSGNLDATGVVITDVLPTGFTISSITSVSGGVLTTLTGADYKVDPETNTLTIPDGETVTISVPAAVGGTPGTTVVTITGSIAEE